MECEKYTKVKPIIRLTDEEMIAAQKVISRDNDPDNEWNENE